MTTQNDDFREIASSFIEEAIGDEHLRIEKDFGQGYVRLRTSEAEKRQAAQDIRSSEDVVIELLRNARDAHARNIFLATHREADKRTIVMIDDGCGLPDDMRELIFEPRVTSKLDTAALDRWGLHGRGMALYSIKVNSASSSVVDSAEGRGTAIRVVLDMGTVTERADQSTFPHFEQVDGKMCMRGPKNILRTAAEFSLEHRDDVNVYCGSFTEIASAMSEYAVATCSPAFRAFYSNIEDCKLVQRLAFAADAADFSRIASQLGLEMSERSSRRIMDGEIAAAVAMLERVRGGAVSAHSHDRKASKNAKPRGTRKNSIKIAQDDLNAFSKSIACAYKELAESYFLDADIEPRVGVSGGALRVEIPLINAD